MRTKYNFGLPVGAGGRGAYKKVAKVAFSASKCSTSLYIFAYTASNAIDSPNFVSALFITSIGSQIIF